MNIFDVRFLKKHIIILAAQGIVAEILLPVFCKRLKRKARPEGMRPSHLMGGGWDL